MRFIAVSLTFEPVQLYFFIIELHEMNSKRMPKLFAYYKRNTSRVQKTVFVPGTKVEFGARFVDDSQTWVLLNYSL